MRVFQFLILVIIGFLVSCETDLDVNIQQDNRLVVNSIISTYEPFTLKLTKSRNILHPDDKVKIVDDASVLIYNENNELIDQLLYYREDTIYKSYIYPEAGKIYKLKILHHKYPDVEASTRVPDIADAKLTAKFYGMENPDNGYTLLNLKITRESSQNYYFWDLTYTDLALQNQKASMSSLDSKIDNIIPYDDVLQERIFLKESNSSSQVLETSFYTSDLNHLNLSSAELKLYAVSKDAYDYYRSIEIYKKTNDHYINPVEIVSNIQGGLGVFGAKNEINIGITE